MENLHIGQSATYTKTFHDDDIRLFSTISGDDNPIHLDDEYAKQTIFKRRIVQGFLTGSLISAIIANKLPGRGSIYLNQDMNFLKPVFIGDTITAKVIIKDIDINKSYYFLDTFCLNQNNELVLSGSAKVKFKII